MNPWRVTRLDVDAEASAGLLEALQTDEAVLRFVAGDVSREDDVQQAVAETIQAWGRLDGLVNNAGIAHPYHEPVERLCLAVWDRMLAVNLTGCFLCARAAVPCLWQQGAIVNTASTRAFPSELNTELTPHLKAAWWRERTRSARRQSCRPIWIEMSDRQQRSQRRAIELRAVDHAQHPMGCTGCPADVAALVAFLLSEKAGFITGQTLVVDGGMIRKMSYVA